ncbi:MAG TPA: TRAP transporter small permease [Burkholderiaceae bacterium]|nr:TRAP transporter small permease [Burkholderiaceae bacterium]
MTSLLCKLRRVLDAIYFASGALAAIFLFAILVIIVAQMIARASGISFPGSTDYAGYMMAAASFMAFAYTLNKGGHVRVSIILGRLSGKTRYVAELICHLLASVFSSIVAWYACMMVYWSYVLGDVSQGQDASPLWIVQTPVAVGSVILALCFVDNLISMLIRKRDNIAAEIV